MAKKKQVTAKTPKKKAPRSAAPKQPAKAKAARPKRSSPKKAAPNSSSNKAVSFEDAKSAAIDSLLDSIEAGERKLVALKQAGTHDELKKACQT